MVENIYAYRQTDRLSKNETTLTVAKPHNRRRGKAQIYNKKKQRKYKKEIVLYRNFRFPSAFTTIV